MIGRVVCFFVIVFLVVVNLVCVLKFSKCERFVRCIMLL